MKLEIDPKVFLWFLVFGLWSLVFGLWSLVFGLWSSVFGLDPQRGVRKLPSQVEPDPAGAPDTLAQASLYHSSLEGRSM